MATPTERNVEVGQHRAAWALQWCMSLYLIRITRVHVNDLFILYKENLLMGITALMKGICKEHARLYSSIALILDRFRFNTSVCATLCTVCKPCYIQLHNNVLHTDIYYIMSYHIISCHIMSNHIISYKFTCRSDLCWKSCLYNTQNNQPHS